ncbi:MAG: glycosyltransferase family 2 protein, partial [Burkholderiales bacterium]|nr:glycosyltransferase family 2 protein [Burkholderiales bacterium]
MVSLSIELCALIPVYNHEKTVGDVARALLAKNMRLILVNDGSSPECRESLIKLANEHPHQVILLEHPINQGKGAAVMTGLRHADFLHVSHVLQIDADGQHNTDDIARFIT